MTLWRPWTIVLRGVPESPQPHLPFLRFFTRWGAQKWLREAQGGRHTLTVAAPGLSRERAESVSGVLTFAYVERIDRVNEQFLEQDSEHNQEHAHDGGDQKPALPPTG
jgi:hypothetical protein